MDSRDVATRHDKIRPTMLKPKKKEKHVWNRMKTNKNELEIKIERRSMNISARTQELLS